MINIYEIPQESRLYFGEIARKKREIETIAADFLSKMGFEEIVTPIFSYHQTLNNKKSIISFGDTYNNQVSLRADSAQDVVRLVTKRLGRSTEHKKWFYIQPVLRYPTSEFYQIGAELIENGDISQSVNLVSSMLNKFEQKFTMQLGHIKIPKIISEILDIDISFFATHNIDKLYSLNIKWLNELIELTSKDELKSFITKAPFELKDTLQELLDSAKRIESSIVLTPLYYSNMEYYNSLFFRAIYKNSQIAMGGCYTVENKQANGFAIYTDELLK